MNVYIHVYNPVDYLGKLGRLLYWQKPGHVNIQIGGIIWDACLSVCCWCRAEPYLEARPPIRTYQVDSRYLLSNFMSPMDIAVQLNQHTDKDFGPHNNCVHHTARLLRAICVGITVPPMCRIPKLEAWCKTYAKKITN